MDAPALTPHDEQYRRQMDRFEADLWQDLARVPTLQADAAEAVVTYLLELACRSAHIRPITIGREALVALPRAWLLARIERLAEPLVALHDEWEYRRLLEVLWLIDRRLVWNLAHRGLDSTDAGISEAAGDFLGKLEALRGDPDAVPW